jgi:hypothetical protein
MNATTRSPISGDILQIEYAWLVVEHERLVDKLGAVLHVAGRVLAVARGGRALPSHGASVGARLGQGSQRDRHHRRRGTGHVVELGGKPWSAGMPDRRR